MTEQTPPPGWYPDDTGQQRYWDGNAWTEHTQGAAPGASTPVTSSPSAGGVWPPTEYLEGAPSTFESAIRNGLQNLTVFSGRASRSSFWWFYLAQALIGFGAYLIFIIGASLSDVLGFILGLAYLVVAVALLIAFLAVGVRRLHDTNRSGWWLLLGLVPCVSLILIVFFVLESTPGPNQYNGAAGGARAT